MIFEPCHPERTMPSRTSSSLRIRFAFLKLPVFRSIGAAVAVVSGGACAEETEETSGKVEDSSGGFSYKCRI